MYSMMNVCMKRMVISFGVICLKKIHGKYFKTRTYQFQQIHFEDNEDVDEWVYGNIYPVRIEDVNMDQVL